MTTSIFEELRDARRRTDEVFPLMAAEGLRERPIPERHRPLFYLGHLEAFDWNLLTGGEGAPVDPGRPHFDRLFAFGIDPVDGALPDDRPDDWPPADEVRTWGARARQAVDALPARAPIDPV